MDCIFSHPKKVCMTYFEHLTLSLNFSYLFAKGSIKALIHAFLPNLYIKSTTNIVNHIQLQLQQSGCNKNQ